jgi:hypothetical protein
MRQLLSRQVGYPQFSIGSTPMPVECTVSVVEANDRR